MATFILQLPMAQQHLARFNPGVLLLLVQVLQLVDVILTLGFTFLQVDIRKNSLYYQYLEMIRENKTRWSDGYISTSLQSRHSHKDRLWSLEGLFMIHVSNQSQPH